MLGQWKGYVTLRKKNTNIIVKLFPKHLQQVQLMSRDEQSVLLVTYAELKNCLENAFSELVANAAAT